MTYITIEKPKPKKRGIPITCTNCGHKWRTVRKYDAYCPQCGVVHKVKDFIEYNPATTEVSFVPIIDKATE